MHIPLVIKIAFFAILVAPAAAVEWRPEGPFLGNVNDLAFVADSPQVVYAATANGGVWRSDDGGRTWILPGQEMTSRNVRWIEVDPGNNGVIWAGLRASGNRAAMWRSPDRGETWAAVSEPYSGAMRMRPVGQRIAFSPTQPKSIYVPSTNLHYRSADGGTTWSGLRIPNQDAYVFAFHPNDPNIILAGGRGQSQNVSRSMDGGKTWRQTGIGLGNNSVKAMFFDPGEPSTLYSVAANNVFKSTDQGDEWAQLTLTAGRTGDVYQLTMDPRNSGELWAATEKGLLRSSDGGSTWTKTVGGLGGYLIKTLAFDPAQPSRMLAGASGSGIFESHDGGLNWSPVNQEFAAGWTKNLYGSPSSDALFAQMSVGLYRLESSGTWTLIEEPFEEPNGIAFDRGASNVLYAYDTSRYWLSRDEGKRWKESKVKGPSMKDMMKGRMETPQFASFVQDRGNTKIFFAGAWSNDAPGTTVYKTTDAGKKWKPSGQGLPGEKVKLLVAIAPDKLVADMGKYGVFRTTDGGGSWTNAQQGLPDADIFAMAADATVPPRVFAATEQGLFVSTDLCQSWSLSKEGLKGDSVQALVVDPKANRIFVGTFHGVFMSDDGGDTWVPLSDGLRHTDVRALAVAGSPSRLWAGTAGGSVFSTPLP